jgi:hypothetical protein
VFLEEFDANYFDFQPLHFGLADRKLRAIAQVVYLFVPTGGAR